MQSICTGGPTVTISIILGLLGRRTNKVRPYVPLQNNVRVLYVHYGNKITYPYGKNTITSCRIGHMPLVCKAPSTLVTVVAKTATIVGDHSRRGRRIWRL